MIVKELTEPISEDKKVCVEAKIRPHSKSSLAKRFRCSKYKFIREQATSFPAAVNCVGAVLQLTKKC